MKLFTPLLLLIISQFSAFTQKDVNPCSHTSIVNRHLAINPAAEDEIIETEVRLQQIIRSQLKLNKSREISYVIPVVMHVFHSGDDGKMGMDQALSGLEILNADFNGHNDGWESIDSEFDSIKGTLDITFCLATLDPDGNPTTGLIYHEDEDALYNKGNLFEHAWDNYKYLNIYFPKYTQGAPSDFTAYAYYPSTSNANSNRDGIFYSSIRWGYGDHSELDDGDDWASVCSHEAGHWLNLRHTFEGGCFSPGDLVDDTPLTNGGNIELEGCYNNDFSCGERTNGENFLDYNHRCKKMFTLGQVQRMEAALSLPSRVKLWSEDNLIETGCMGTFSSIKNIKSKDLVVYPNPSGDQILFKSSIRNYRLVLYNGSGQVYENMIVKESEIGVDLTSYPKGVYFYKMFSENTMKSGKFVKQ